MQEKVTPLWVMKILGYDPDPWQVEVLETARKRMLLNCSRQAGKSTVVAVLALVEALANPMHKVLIISRSQRQSREVFRICTFFHELLKGHMKQRKTNYEIEFTNYSRIVCLPCKEDTIRGFARVNLLIIDEAARVPDDVYRAVRPMLAVSNGRMVCLSTPYGKRGFFYKEWSEGGDDWLRIEIPASLVSRIEPAFLEQERRSLGETFFRQEYFCAFEALQGLVYPDMAKCVVASLPPGLDPNSHANLDAAGEAHEALAELNWAERYTMSDDAWDEKVRERIARHKRLSAEKGDPLYDLPPWLAVRYGLTPTGPGSKVAAARELEWVGGIDFGFRNPFAAVWGVVDADGVLWLFREH